MLPIKEATSMGREQEENHEAQEQVAREHIDQWGAMAHDQHGEIITALHEDDNGLRTERISGKGPNNARKQCKVWRNNIGKHRPRIQ